MSQPMSNEFARSRMPRIAEAAVERARLTVVPRRVGRAPRVPFVALVSLILVGGVAGLLLFNTSMQQASFRATALEQHAQALAAQEQSLQMELEMLRDPQRVATEARAMGMVPPANPAFLRLSDGQVLGNPTPAVPQDGIRVAPLPAPKPKLLRPDVVIVPAPETARDADGAASGARGDAAGTTDQRDREGRAAGQQGSDR